MPVSREIELSVPQIVKEKKRAWGMYEPALFRINTGSCNGCDVETAPLVLPRFGMAALGCRFCESAEEADIVLFTGPLSVRIRDTVMAVWETIPQPKASVALGVCPISGGIFRESYSVCAPVERYLPIDVNVPGCPPRPQAIVQGVEQALDIWSGRR